MINKEIRLTHKIDCNLLRFNIDIIKYWYYYVVNTLVLNQGYHYVECNGYLAYNGYLLVLKNLLFIEITMLHN